MTGARRAASLIEWLGALLLDRNANRVAPLRPAAIVVPHRVVAEQVREHQPGVARALADPAVRDHVVVLLEASFAFIDRAELVGALERAVRIRRARPWNAL